MLIGWFPLNNNLNNQGIENWTVTSSGITYDTGKVTNKCALFDVDADYIKVGELNQLNSLEQYSFSCWVYINALSTYSSYASAFLSSGDWNTPGGHFVFGVYNYNNGFRRILVPNTVNCYTGINLAQEDAIQLNTWYNITITFDGELTRGYINGKYVGSRAGCKIPSTNVSYFYMGAATYYTGFTIKGKLNDIRIYDHVLSPTEIKKLAQGLACHFTFNFEDFYTPVDYLESTGEQYIDTGIEVDADLETHLEYAFSSYDNNERYIFGLDSPTVIGMISGHGRIYEFGAERHSYTLNYDRHTAIVGKRIIFDGTVISNSISGWSTGKHAFLFCSNTGSGSPNYYSSSKLYSCKMYNNDGLVRDFMPCIRNTDNKPGLYDWVEHKFYKNEGVNQDFKAPYYAPIEYITADANAYIDTGYKINSEKMMVDIKFKLPSSFHDLSLFGSNSSVYDLVPWHDDGYGSQVFKYWVGGSGGLGGTDFATDINHVLFTIKDNYLYINTDEGQGSVDFTGSIKSGKNFFIFGKNGNGTSMERSSGYTLYYLKLYDNDILVRDFIPVQDMLTGEVGLYDNVENKFYTNAGSGSFSAPFRALTEMVDCSGYLINGSGTDITESQDTAWGNSCAVFNGTNSQIIYNGALLSGQPTELTFGGWFYRDDWTYSGDQALIVRGGSDYAFNLMYENPNGLGLKIAVFWVEGSGRKYLQQGLRANSQLSPGWHQIYAVYDRESLSMYVDGVFKFKTTTLQDISASTVSPYLLFGNNSSSGRPFNGKIADVRVYATALSAADIQALYQNRLELDENKSLYGGNFIEHEGPYELTKENICSAEEFCEEPGNFRWEDKDGFQELEYIESTGTQYIDTGFVPNQDTHVEMSILDSTAGAYYFGVMTDEGQFWKNHAFAVGNDGTNVYTGYDGQGGGDGAIIPSGPHRIEQNKNLTIVDGTTRRTLDYTEFSAEFTLYLFAQNRSNTAKPYPQGQRIKGSKCRIYDNGTLVRDFIPVIYDRTGEVGLYDLVEKKFYGNEGTGNFIAGPSVHYYEIEYIETTGSQYIDTEVIPDARTTIDTDLFATGGYIFGCGRDEGAGGNAFLGAYCNPNNQTIVFEYGAVSCGGYIAQTPNRTKIYTELNNNTYKVNNSGTQWSGNITTRTTSGHFLIGAVANSAAQVPAFYASCKYYAFKIYDNGNLIRDFIPAIRQESGEVGLFDKVHGGFYTNKGSGSLTAGPRVNETYINKALWVVGRLVEE